MKKIFIPETEEKTEQINILDVKGTSKILVKEKGKAIGIICSNNSDMFGDDFAIIDFDGDEVENSSNLIELIRDNSRFDYFVVD